MESESAPCPPPPAPEPTRRSGGTPSGRGIGRCAALTHRERAGAPLPATGAPERRAGAVPRAVPRREVLAVQAELGGCTVAVRASVATLKMRPQLRNPRL